MLEILKYVLPMLLVALIVWPLYKVFTGQVDKKSAKRRLYTHVAMFFGLVAFVFLFALGSRTIFAQETDAAESIVGTLAQGLGFISAALATGMSALGAGIAVAAAAPAAIGAISENEKNFGKAMIFVALGEGVAIYGLLISILIINSL